MLLHFIQNLFSKRDCCMAASSVFTQAPQIYSAFSNAPDGTKPKQNQVLKIY